MTYLGLGSCSANAVAAVLLVLRLFQSTLAEHPLKYLPMRHGYPFLLRNCHAFTRGSPLPVNALNHDLQILSAKWNPCFRRRP